ncbi:MAG: hypothetical protein RRA94_01240 [Bacteroidota bacterium]|nr:hypothetical protein [Bacteroidota bacterium]
MERWKDGIGVNVSIFPSFHPSHRAADERATGQEGHPSPGPGLIIPSRHADGKDAAGGHGHAGLAAQYIPYAAFSPAEN